MDAMLLCDEGSPGELPAQLGVNRAFCDWGWRDESKRPRARAMRGRGVSPPLLFERGNAATD